MISPRREIIEAGAGCGKTTGLVSRYLEALGVPRKDQKKVTTGKMRPQEILALTFTEEAASNMRERVVKALLEVGQTQLAGEVIEKSQISTFHSHCYKILGRELTSLGYSTELLAEPLVERLRTRQILALLSESENAENLLKAFDSKKLTQFILKLWFKPGYSPKVDLEHHTEHFEKTIAHLRSKMSEFKLSHPDVFSKHTDFWATTFERDLTMLDLKTLSSRDYDFRKGPRLKDADFLELKEFATHFRDFIKKAYPLALLKENLNNEITLHKLAQNFLSDVQQKSKKYLDFAALEAELFQLLNTKTREELNLVSPKLLLVDEFQDTNPTQFKIIEKLSATDTEWYFVGDPKQSIYAFRQADVGLFINLSQKLERIGLDTNYRSRSAVLDFSNEVQHRLFPKTARAFDPAEQTLKYGREAKEGDPPDHFVKLYESDDAKESFFDRAIEQIRHSLSLPLKPDSSVGVLFRSWKKLYAFSDKLTELKIPHKISGNPQFFDHILSGLFADYIDWALNPDSKTGLMAIYQWIKKAPRNSQDLKTHYEPWASGLRARIKELSFDVLFHNFVELTQPHHFEFGEEWACAVETFIDESIQNRSLDELTLFDYAKLFRTENKKLEVTHPRLEGFNAAHSPVTLLTIHGSKGLEFQEVFLLELFEKRQSRASKLVEGEDDAAVADLVLHDQESNAPYPSLLFKSFFLKNRANEDAEQKRLLYVALTRTISKLHVFFHTPKDSAKDTSFLEAFLGIEDAAPLFWNRVFAELRSSAVFDEQKARGLWLHEVLPAWKQEKPASVADTLNSTHDRPKSSASEGKFNAIRNSEMVPEKSSAVPQRWRLPHFTGSHSSAEPISQALKKNLGVREWIKIYLIQNSSARSDSTTSAQASSGTKAPTTTPKHLLPAQPFARTQHSSSVPSALQRGKDFHALLEVWNGEQEHLKKLCPANSSFTDFSVLAESLKAHPRLKEYFDLTTARSEKVFRELPIIVELLQYRLTGIVDALYMRSNEEIILIDWKTGSSLENLSNADRKESLKMQLSVYAQPFLKKGMRVHGLGVAIAFHKSFSDQPVEIILDEPMTLRLD